MPQPQQPFNALSLLPVKQIVDRVVTDVRFRSDFTIEKELLNSQEITDILLGKPKPPGPPSTTSRVLGLLKPTFIVNTPRGPQVYAPYGEADPRNPSMWKGRLNLLLLTAVLVIGGAGFALGRVTKR